MFFYKNGEKKYDGQYSEGKSYDIPLLKINWQGKNQSKLIKVKGMEMVRIMR
jgi:hypothetical protein